MNSERKINPKETAILCMDYQKDIVNSYAAKQDVMLSQAANILDVCRQYKVLVIYVVVQFRNGYPEIGSQNKTFAGVSKTGRFVIGSSGAEVHESVSPKDDDIIVTKRRVSGFAGSDLDLILRARQIKRLVLFGIATSGVVLSTLRQAADMDYECMVLEDLCADQDAEVHQCLVAKIFPRQAEMMTSMEFIGCLAQN
jgi:nicotinamidase-related amidase